MTTNDWLDQIQAEQSQLRELYGDALDEIAAILFRVDPVGISYAEDEYEFEAVYILRRLPKALSSEDAKGIVTDVLVAQFGEEWYGEWKDLRSQKRDEAAAEIWLAWQRHQADSR